MEITLPNQLTEFVNDEIADGDDFPGRPHVMRASIHLCPSVVKICPFFICLKRRAKDTD